MSEQRYVAFWMTKRKDCCLENNITTGGFVIINATSPIGIRESLQVKM